QHCFEKALELEPNNASLHARIGWAYVELGEPERARESFQTACSLEPKSADYWRSLVGVTKVERDDGILESLEALLRSGRTSELAELHYAFAKALTDVGDNAGAFRHVLLGAKERRKQIRYDEEAILGRMARTAELFAPELAKRWVGSGNSSRLPI